MKQRTVITALLLGGFVVALVILLMREAARGPTFRAADHATYPECIAAIPFAPGSLEYSGAERACEHEHGLRRRPRGR